MIRFFTRRLLFFREAMKLIRREPNDMLLGQKIRALTERYDSGKPVSAASVISDLGRGNI